MKQKLKGDMLAIVAIVIVIAITTGVIGWISAKKLSGEKKATEKSGIAEISKNELPSQSAEVTPIANPQIESVSPIKNISSFRFENLQIDLEIVNVGKPVVISFEIYNDGNIDTYPGSYTVDFNGGSGKENKKTTTCSGVKMISPGEKCKVVYSLVYSSYGTRTIAVAKTGNDNIRLEKKVRVVDSSKMIVMFPNGGEVWKKGEKNVIMWSKGKINSDKIDIVLYKGNECGLNTYTKKQICGRAYDLSPVPPTALVLKVPNNGRYEWTVPTSLPSGNDYRMGIGSSNFNPLMYQSESPFSIE